MQPIAIFSIVDASFRRSRGLVTIATNAAERLRPLGEADPGREVLPVRILQVGAGNFLRGFADWMVQRANDAGVLRHGIAVMKATPRPELVTGRLTEQAGMFHVVLDGVRDGRPFSETTLVTAVQSVVDAYREWDLCRDLMREETLSLVISNTTDAGIVYTPDDLSAAPPASFPAKMTALLHERWSHFAGDPRRGLSFLPCELIEDNGATLRSLVVRHAREAALAPQFVDWVTEHCRFYDTIVDRIVPGLPEPEAAELRASLGFDDRLIVRGEHYADWAIAGGPAIRDEFPLDRAGLPVRFMPDIRPYRERKVRILNGTHTAMAAVGPLLGCHTVRDAVQHPAVGAYLHHLLQDEVLPSLPSEDPEELRQYTTAILDRFRNPALHHLLADIRLNALAKWRTRNLPVVLDAWSQGRRADLGIFAFACLLTSYAGAFGEMPVRDDETLVAGLRSGFDATHPDRWIADFIASLDWPELSDTATAARLTAETGAHVRALLANEPAHALQTLLAGHEAKSP
ncbi:tagaturonate reductase [Actinoplanes tereljensis]|uniref:Altronate oxidoreductase n=1 Tax=Paractinoplanes tereljensis TaxID=571912 RepID=A0A919NSJ1_9ACTN|nr:tagaturonate reductase [Actinoplanes tereljensis]GIF23548.1 altronate oxidoreductase [Actinoplanes tereljensis]